MITLIWKELRENLKWAILAAFVLGVAEMHGLYQTEWGTMEYNGPDGITLCRLPFLTVTTFGCAVVGFLLGLIQILPELKRDRWAALLHRPVSRGVIFRGKVISGLFLYALATVTPFLYAVWLVATPGHFGAPFVPEMVFPGTADICMGAVYYFAALALALVRGLNVLRVLPLLAAVHASYFILNTVAFSDAVTAAVLMSLALFTAAWGLIYHQELLRARPWLGKVAFLAVVFYGVCGLSDLAWTFLSAVGSSGHSKQMRYEMFDDGVPLKLTYVDNIVTAVEDTQGKTVVGDRYKPDRVRTHIRYLGSFSEYIGDSHGWKWKSYPNPYRNTYTYLSAYNSYVYPRQEQWFYLTKSRNLVGYLPGPKAAFAQFGPNGFQPPGAPVENFPSEINFSTINDEILYLWSPQRIQIADLIHRTITDFPLPAPGPIYNMGVAQIYENNQRASIIGFAFNSGLVIYDDKQVPITTLVYHHDPDRWGQIQLGTNITKDRFYVWYQPSAWIDGRTRDTMDSYVEEVDAANNVIHTYTLPPLPHFPDPRSWHTFLGQRVQSPAFFFGGMLYAEVGAAFGSKPLRDFLNWQWGHDRRLTEEICAYVIVLSLVLAVVTLWWARYAHLSWRRAWAWAGFVFAFNLPGLITFRLAADWPRQIRCPSCTKTRPIDLDNCPHCGAAWPAPPVSGLEIIENTPAPTLTALSV